MSADRRAALAAAQQELVAALVAGGPVPPGFDPERVAVQARALLAKRAAVASGHHRWLAELLGPGYLPEFADYARGRPQPVGGSGRDDAAGFEAHLRSRDALPPGGPEPPTRFRLLGGPRNWLRWMDEPR